MFWNIFCRSQNGDQLFLAEPRSRRHIHHNLLHSEPGKDRNHTFLFPEEREIEFLTHLDVCMNTRPVHKNLSLEFSKNPGSFMLHFDR